ncbi:TRAP transporter large permease [Petroclostridium sp. X23]|uniref:TRAP transporter large permease n=1 Tax=Petroclostridium sp. X23 TaxID=3045146 RepID=UPI0024AE808B|nr:TRAP transporter large permease [Petroclostridium sp. X23]WHH59083.1 TRAP transporter large permease [Petroclostridium sp. X23]
MLILFGVFFILLILGVPVGFSLFGSSVLYMVVNDIPLEMAAQRLAAGPDSFPLLAIAFFVLAGSIMNSGGITRKIFDFADHIVGHFTGGLGHANILASIIFSGMSGSAVADTGGLGAIELQAMKEAGYDEDFSLAVTGASAIIGPIIPPSIPAVIFGVTSGVSIGRLFAGGVIPGLLMGGAMSAMVYFISKKKKYPKRKRASFKEIFHALKSAFLPLLAPVIIIGGIIGGVFTPTEAAIAAVFYALLLSFIYKEIRITQLPGFLRETLNTTIGILFIISSANLFGWIMTTSQVPQKLAVAFLSVIADKYLALLVLNVFLLLVGCFLETSAAQIILVPILVPMVMKMGVDPVHFGIIMILNLMIGLMTPPIGLVLYVLSSISKVPFEKISKAILPYVLVLGVVLLVITYVPILVTFLPDLLFGN